jgi:hypothetical protein
VDPLLEPPSFSEEAFRELEHARARFLLRSASAEGFRSVVHWLEWMRSRAAPIPIVVQLIPDEFQVEDGLMRECLAPLGATLEEVDRPQRLMTELLELAGFEVLDLLPALQAVAPLPDGKRHLYRVGGGPG